MGFIQSWDDIEPKRSLMPPFQAIVPPVAGKNCQKSAIPQVEHKTIALLSHNFLLFFVSHLLKSPPDCDTHQDKQYHLSSSSCEVTHTNLAECL